MNTLTRWWCDHVPAWEDVLARLKERPLFSFVCPLCEGYGGWTEVVDYYIGGPYYDCTYCKTKGWVTCKERLHWWLWCNDNPHPLLDRILNAYVDWKYRKEANQ